jgi:hypothetical protein
MLEPGNDKQMLTFSEYGYETPGEFNKVSVAINFLIKILYHGVC